MNPIIYLNGRYLSENEAVISVNDRGFMFADGTYDVLRGVNGKLFHGKEHFNRLNYCLKELRIEFSDTEQLLPVIDELILANDLMNSEYSVYLQITRGVFKRTHIFPTEFVNPTVFISVKKFNPYIIEFNEGVKCITVEDIRWHRCDIKTIALLANVLAVQQAYEQNAYEAIFIRNGMITEASHSNVFGVIGDVIFTHPRNNQILSGISREILIELCKSNGYKIIEEAIPASRIDELSELMVVGTSTEVMPVVQLNNKIIGNGKPGKIQQNLQKIFTDYMKNYFQDTTEPDLKIR